MLLLYLHSRLNTWLQWIGNRITARRGTKHLSFGIWCCLYQLFHGILKEEGLYRKPFNQETTYTLISYMTYLRCVLAPFIKTHHFLMFWGDGMANMYYTSIAYWYTAGIWNTQLNMTHVYLSYRPLFWCSDWQYLVNKRSYINSNLKVVLVPLESSTSAWEF